MTVTTSEGDHNAQLKASRIRRKINRQQGWINRSAAAVEIRRRQANAELRAMGQEEIEAGMIQVEQLTDEALAMTAAGESN